MSFGGMDWAWRKAKVESSTQRVILMGMAACSDDETGLCFPSYGYLAEHGKVTRRTAITVIAAMERAGLFEVKRRGRRSNIYRLPAELWGGEKISLEKAWSIFRASEKISPRSETISPPSEIDDTLGGETISPIISHKEPITEEVTGPVLPEPVKPASDNPLPAPHVDDPNHPDPLRPRAMGRTDDSPIVLMIPVNASGGRPAAITENQVVEWKQLYPGINMVQELLKIRRWNVDNSSSRKTAGKVWGGPGSKGLANHIHFWLIKEQNSARSGSRGHSRPPERTEVEIPKPEKTCVTCGKGLHQSSSTNSGRVFRHLDGNTFECDGSEMHSTREWVVKIRSGEPEGATA